MNSTVTLDIGLTTERRQHILTPPLIDRTHTKNDPWIPLKTKRLSSPWPLRGSRMTVIAPIDDAAKNITTTSGEFCEATHMTSPPVTPWFCNPDASRLTRRCSAPNEKTSPVSALIWKVSNSSKISNEHIENIETWTKGQFFADDFSKCTFKRTLSFYHSMSMVPWFQLANWRLTLHW